MNIIFSSCGNDSLAITQYAFDNSLSNIIVAYSDTQWATPDWAKRIEKVKAWVEGNGAKFVTIKSEGFANLVRRKKAFPANGMGFCSYELKIKPAQGWLEEIDPDKEASCYVGIMRIESQARRNWPEITEASPNHGGRKLIAPMASWKIEQRDALITRAGFEVLEHRSLECSPCINANIKDLQQIAEPYLIKVELLEEEMGFGVRSGKPKFMFRPAKMQGASGIRQVKAWADQGGGKYSPLQEDLFGCDTGFCGM